MTGSQVWTCNKIVKIVACQSLVDNLCDHHAFEIIIIRSYDPTDINRNELQCIQSILVTKKAHRCFLSSLSGILRVPGER